MTRECVGCRKPFERSKLLRIVRTKNGEVVLGPLGHVEGRSAYLCREPACVEAAKKGKKLERALKSRMPEDFWNALQCEREKAPRAF